MVEINFWLLHIAIVLTFIAFLIAIVSIVKFSSILIKLVVLEVLTNLLMAVIAIWALVNKQPIFINICLTLALIMFLGTVAYYQFLSTKDSIDASNKR